MPGILIGQLDELGGGSALWDGKLHAGCQLSHCVEVGWDKGQHDPLGALLERQVVPHEEGPEHFAFGSVLDVLQEAVLARDQLAVTNPQNDADGIVAVAGQTDRVGVAAAHDLYRLRLLELVQPFQRVTQLRGALVILGVTGLVHPLPQPGTHLERLSRQEQQYIVDHAAVLFPALGADARRLAARDMKVETGPVGGVVGQIPGAGSHGEDPADDFQRLPQRCDVGVRPEIARAGDGDAPDHQHARKRLGQRDRDLRITLIVAQPDVELRLVFLDERVFEQQRLRLGRHDDRFEIGDLPLEHLPLRTALVIGEVLRDARAKVRRFSDIHDLPGPVFPEIDAGMSGKCR